LKSIQGIFFEKNAVPIFICPQSPQKNSLTPRPEESLLNREIERRENRLNGLKRIYQISIQSNPWLGQTEIDSVKYTKGAFASDAPLL
jgi:hypothetical protein